MIQFVVFSYARPLQLHGYLTSLFGHWEGAPHVSVIVKATPPFEAAYEWVRGAFPHVMWRPETDFAADVKALVDPAFPYTSFGCDDVVYVAPVAERAIHKAFTQLPGLLGLSLRLGRNVIRDMFGVSLPQPVFNHAYRNLLVWDVTHSHSLGDWAYPWEVLGTVYPTDYVQRMLGAFPFASPSQLEERGSRAWSEHTDRRLMAAYPTSRLVVPTVNIVQHEFPNGIRGPVALPPELLLECWNSGLRLDVPRFVDMQPETWRVADFYLRRAA